MLHRDISVHNIMYQMHGEYYHFVLIDFDMAIVIPKGESSYPASSRHRTGTLPFMAADLLLDAFDASTNAKDWKPIKHLLRHDLESLFWVSFWSLMTLPMKGLDQEMVEKTVQSVWILERGNLRTISFTKSGLLRSGFQRVGLVFPPAADCVEDWLDRFAGVLNKGLMASDSWATRKRGGYNGDSDESDADEPESVWETGGGNITPENLKAKLVRAYTIDEYYTKQSAGGNTRVKTGTKKAKTTTRAKAQTTTRNASRNKPAKSRPKVADTRLPVRKNAKAIRSAPSAAPDSDIRSRLRPRKSVA